MKQFLNLEQSFNDSMHNNEEILTKQAIELLHINHTIDYEEAQDLLSDYDELLRLYRIHTKDKEELVINTIKTFKIESKLAKYKLPVRIKLDEVLNNYLTSENEFYERRVNSSSRIR